MSLGEQGFAILAGHCPTPDTSLYQVDEGHTIEWPNSPMAIRGRAR